MTPQMFAEALLRRLGMPVTDNNVAALVAVQVIEGGHAHNSALYNPMNTTWDFAGSRVASGFSVPAIRAYNNWDDGLEATALTLLKGKPEFRYGPILDALHRSAPPDDTLKAWSASSWGWGTNPVAAAKAYLVHAKDEYPGKGGPLDFVRYGFLPSLPHWKTALAVGAVALGVGMIVSFVAKNRSQPRSRVRVLRSA